MERIIIMKRIYMIDSENVGTNFIKGIENLTRDDKVIYFKGNTVPRNEIEILRLLSESDAGLEIIERHEELSKNALDFQLCTYAGYIIGSLGLGDELYIVTNDKGYEASISFLKKLCEDKVTIKRVSDLTKMQNEENERNELNAILCDFTKYVRKTAADAVKKSATKQQLHDYLQKNLNKDDCDRVYQLIKKKVA